MLDIKEIHIKNFRSIVDMKIYPDDLNILVGLNDSGKSNVLKALNLFFNGQTDENCEFNFKTDYSKFASKINKKASAITIQLKISIPENYKDAGDFT